MADDTDLNAMKDLTQAMYDREYAKIAPVLAREGAILRDLGRLDRLQEDTADFYRRSCSVCFAMVLRGSVEAGGQGADFVFGRPSPPH